MLRNYAAALLLASAPTPLVPISAALAQESPAGGEARAKVESVTIEPYTGPPIFLPERDPPPPPTVAERRLVTENFRGTDTVRFERNVARMSDNSLLSDGPHKEYFSSGKLYAEGEYAMGKPSGDWTYYHENGEVAKKVSYVDGSPDGEVRVNDSQGKPLAVRAYKRGKRNGKWVVYAPGNDKPQQEQSYTDGKADGEWVTYYSDGQVRQKTFFEMGARTGLTTQWASNGDKRAEVNFADGVQHGKTTIWDRSGKVIERTYEKGKLIDQKEVSPGK